MSRSALDRGFRMEEPDVELRWGAPVEEVLRTFVANGFSEPSRVTGGYYTTVCQALPGLRVKAGLHFHPEDDSGLFKELELFDNGERDIDRSYQLFHQKLIDRFGRPTIKRRGDLGDSMPYCEWHTGSLLIIHYVIDRFGPEEHLVIRHRAAVFGLAPHAVAAVVASIAVLIVHWWCSEGRPL